MSKKKNLDVYLAEVFKQFIALKDYDFKKSQEVFKSVFEQVKQKMGEQCNYFRKYATQIMYAGSVYDGIKVSKLDEFDMDIVIRLPINYDDGENGIIIENDQPGFVRMKIINAFDNLDKQKEWETCHKVTREWRDPEKYFLQNKFRQWIHSTVQKALNALEYRVTVNNVNYVLTYKASGPAYTLNIRNEDGDEEFLLDVDLVPVIRFSVPRWPKGYRKVEGSQIKDWLVVPKPMKTLQDDSNKNRCWRLSFQDYEREMIKDCQQLKNTIRLVKKLRDALGMKAIASYYIKTLFLWKVESTDKKYWQNKLSVVYRDMVEELHKAIEKKEIPYYWNSKNNLIEGLKPTLQKLYADKLKDVLKSIDANDVEKAVFAMLTTEEITEFKNSTFYQKQASMTLSTSSSTSSLNTIRQNSVSSIVSSDIIPEINNSQDSDWRELIKKLTDRVDVLTDLVYRQNDRLMKLEMEREQAKKLEISGGAKSLCNGLLNNASLIDENVTNLLQL